MGRQDWEALHGQWVADCFRALDFDWLTHQRLSGALEWKNSTNQNTDCGKVSCAQRGLLLVLRYSKLGGGLHSCNDVLKGKMTQEPTFRSSHK